MIVDLVSVGNEPYPFAFAVEPGEIDLDTEGVRLVGGVVVKGELVKHAAETVVTGDIKAPLEIDCTRCLAPIERVLDTGFHASLIATEMLTSEREVQLDEKELDTDVIDGDKIDLTDLVREQVLLNLPEQVYCREDCKGLCPTCGTDLNTNECDCGKEEIDPRWSALKDLK